MLFAPDTVQLEQLWIHVAVPLLQLLWLLLLLLLGLVLRLGEAEVWYECL